MSLPRADIDPDGLLEYSVVFTDRSLNHMSARFVTIMQELLEALRQTYAADSVAVLPGGGTAGMEAVARQLMTGRRTLVVRTGLFSHRWTQIIGTGAITDRLVVLDARPVDPHPQAGWVPPPVDEVVAAIREQGSEVVTLTHVETAAGLLLPDDYVRAVADAVRETGGLLVLDCIASGANWVDLGALGVDVLLSAPQKGWSGSPGTGYVLLGERGRAAVEASTSTSFTLDLQRWLAIAQGYAAGTAAYHVTMATDTIAHNLELVLQTRRRGLEQLREAQLRLGTQVRELLADRGFPSVAAPGFEASSVVVVHTDDPALRSGAAWREVGVQIAAGVPLMCGEPESWSTFRIGLFGLDKLADVDGTVARLREALDRIGR